MLYIPITWFQNVPNQKPLNSMLFFVTSTYWTTKITLPQTRCFFFFCSGCVCQSRENETHHLQGQFLFFYTFFMSLHLKHKTHWQFFYRRACRNCQKCISQMTVHQETHHEITQEAQHWFHWGRKALWSTLIFTQFNIWPFWCHFITSHQMCLTAELPGAATVIKNDSTVHLSLLHYSSVFTHLVLFPPSSFGTWKWVIITRTAAPTPLSEIPVPTLRTTQSLQTYPCQHASDHAATATWEQSRLAVPKMMTQHPWTRAAHHLWLTPLFAPTAPALVSHWKDGWLTRCKYIYFTL